MSRNSCLKILDRDLKEDKALKQIENASRNPFPGRQANRDLIDREILARHADPDEMAHEEEVTRHFHRTFLHAEDVPEGGVVGKDDEKPDFRDHLDVKDCDCGRGEQCQLCVTSRDLVGVPSAAFVVIERKPRILGIEELVVGMALQTANAYGFF
jgi:hypothetical protein